MTRHITRSINQAIRRLRALPQVLAHPDPLDEYRAQLDQIFDAEWYSRQGGGDLQHYLTEGWRAGLDPGPLFSTRWYLEAYPDVVQLDVCPLLHYLVWGAESGREPNPFFNSWWYLRENPDLLREHPDVSKPGLSPLMHYLRYGAAEGRAPSPLFDPVWYAEHNEGAPVERALAHYREFGWRNGRSPHPLFEVQWYRAAYPGAGPDRDPFEHYLLGGWQEGHRPNPLFNPLWYHARYPDSRWLEPLTHYVTHGQFRGYPPSILFDEDYYRQIKPDLGKMRNPLVDYLDGGWRQGYDPHPLFDGNWYRSEWQKNSDRNDFGELSPIGHYLINGVRQGVNPSPLFDAVWYRDSNLDVLKSNIDPLEHYSAYGEFEGRPAFPREPLLAEATEQVENRSADWLIPLPSDLDGTNLVMLACHDQRGIYGVALRHMVRNYHAAGWRVVLGFDHPVQSDAFADCPPDECPDAVLASSHDGYDFFTWRLIWESLDSLAMPARVLLSNDSVIGPLKPLDELTQLIEAHPAEVLGFVESFERLYHLQSWGIAFKGRPLRDGVLMRYLSQVNEGIDKRHLIGRMEVRLGRWAATQGYAVGSIASPISQIDNVINPSISGWRRIIELGVPFIKREVFTLPPQQIRSIPADVIDQLESLGDFEVAPLVRDSLAQIGVADRAPALSDWKR